MNNRKFYIGLIVIFISVILGGCESDDNSVELDTKLNESVVTETTEVFKAYVHISGAVKNPGVYSIEEGARLYQVIDLAGGLTKNAKKNLLNLAEPVADGQKIHIMSKKEYKSQSDSNNQDTKDVVSKNPEASNEQNHGMININTASQQELMELPGIGASKAAAIVTYREENGNFSTIEDITKVSGIGEATFTNIELMITVN